MTKKSEVAVIDFTKFSIAQLPELNGKKEEIKAVIKANPVVEVTDNASYELAKKSRTAVRTLRTSLQGEKTEVVGRIKKNVLEVVANEYDSLIADVKNDENARQEHVTAWEEKKEAERLEKLRLEQERIDGIKSTISLFKQGWEMKISELTFDEIDNLKDRYSVDVSEFDRKSLAEFEVLFEDATNYIDNIFQAKIKVLTEQENIRLEQIRLAEERKKQEEEAKRIAEAQRIEREKFEAEQKEIAEKQRIAQEKFQKEKAEFEAKQAEAKFQERCKQISELGFVLNERNEAYQKGLHYLNLEDIKSASDELWVRELEDAKNVKDFSEMETESGETQEVEFEEPKTDEIAEENYHENDVHEIAKNDSVTLFEIPDKELTWDSLYDNFKNSIEFKKCTANTLLAGFFDYLQKNYEVPQPKNK